MAFRSIAVWLEDASMAINDINEMTKTIHSATEYENNRMVVRATERCLEIIAEAVKNAIKQEPDLHISNKRKIINLRNLISHQYYEVDHERIWTIIKQDLPVLEEEVKNILADYERKLNSNEL